MIPRDPATIAAWRRYSAENAAARLEYRRHPIITASVCEVCGHTSRVAVCRVCSKEKK